MTLMYIIDRVLRLLPPATKLGQGYVFTGVCDSVNRGVSASVHAGITPPWSRHPPGADTPQEQMPPQSRHTLRADTPWEQTPPGSRHPPRVDACPAPLSTHPWQQTPPQSRHPPASAEHAGRYCQRAGGTHPTGMQSCLLTVWRHNDGDVLKLPLGLWCSIMN